MGANTNLDHPGNPALPGSRSPVRLLGDRNLADAFLNPGLAAPPAETLEERAGKLAELILRLDRNTLLRARLHCTSTAEREAVLELLPAGLRQVVANRLTCF